MERKALLAKAIEAREAVQAVVEGLGGEPRKPKPRTILEKVKELGLDPRTYAFIYMFINREKTLEEVAAHLGCSKSTVIRWKKKGFRALKMTPSDDTFE